MVEITAGPTALEIRAGEPAVTARLHADVKRRPVEPGGREVQRRPAWSWTGVSTAAGQDATIVVGPYETPGRYVLAATATASFATDHGGVRKATSPSWIVTVNVVAPERGVGAAKATTLWQLFACMRALAAQSGRVVAVPLPDGLTLDTAIPWKGDRDEAGACFIAGALRGGRLHAHTDAWVVSCDPQTPDLVGAGAYQDSGDLVRLRRVYAILSTLSPSQLAAMNAPPLPPHGSSRLLFTQMSPEQIQALPGYFRSTIQRFYDAPGYDVGIDAYPRDQIGLHMELLPRLEFYVRGRVRSLSVGLGDLCRMVSMPDEAPAAAVEAMPTNQAIGELKGRISAGDVPEGAPTVRELLSSLCPAVAASLSVDAAYAHRRVIVALPAGVVEPACLLGAIAEASGLEWRKDGAAFRLTARADGPGTAAQDDAAQLSLRCVQCLRFQDGLAGELAAGDFLAGRRRWDTLPAGKRQAILRLARAGAAGTDRADVEALLSDPLALEQVEVDLHCACLVSVVASCPGKADIGSSESIQLPPMLPKEASR